MEILFYCLERKSLEDILPGLLERARDRGWRSTVRVDSPERVKALDLHLWTYSDQSFLAHGTQETGFPSRQPVYLTTGDENPNGASVLFLAGGTLPTQWPAGEYAGIHRVVVVFDGSEADARNAAHVSWQNASAAGHTAALWRQNESGKWEQQKPEAETHCEADLAQVAMSRQLR